MSVIEEAYADDVRQKMAINRAVYAAGYGIDPRPYGDPQPRQPSIQSIKEVTKTSSVWPWVVTAASMAMGGFGWAAMLMNAKPDEPPAQQTVEPIKGKLRFYLPDGKEVPTVEREDD